MWIYFLGRGLNCSENREVDFSWSIFHPLIIKINVTLNRLFLEGAIPDFKLSFLWDFPGVSLIPDICRPILGIRIIIITVHPRPSL